ncbi:CD276 antigen-like [Gouania willdenowi]|uniref:CD276 antigen-like n=1 Tax=Gouania willdenowi TaxID=441366 RepID=A0A8C5HHM6_GOUWI|nr:CD276 antigen-like [Gouania willdenowi]
MKFWIKVVQLCFLYVYAAEGFTEINVCCVYGSNCTLSCSFRQETDDLYWSYITKTGQVNVHSFYKNRDQLDHQDPRFNGRTSLVEDQVTGRKTALMLKKVKVQDEGTYKCFVSNRYGYQLIYVVLQVYAPVQTVDMVTSGNSITCSSEGIYPKPELTWSSSPQSNKTVQQTEEKLYNISSSMKLSDMDGDQLNCTVSTRFNNFTSTWMKPSEEHSSSTRSHVFLLVSLISGVAAVIVLICLWKQRKEKLRDKKTKEFRDESICDPESLIVDKVSDSTTASSSS